MNLDIKQRIILFAALTFVCLLLTIATGGFVHFMWGIATIFFGVQAYIDISDYIKIKKS